MKILFISRNYYIMDICCSLYNIMWNKQEIISQILVTYFNGFCYF
jgi:hypothetical protein